MRNADSGEVYPCSLLVAPSSSRRSTRKAYLAVMKGALQCVLVVACAASALGFYLPGVAEREYEYDSQVSSRQPNPVIGAYSAR